MAYTVTKCYGEIGLKIKLWVKYLIAGILAAVFVAVDQLTKLAIDSRLITGTEIKVIDGILHFTYVKNRGAAFGILQGQRVVFLLFTIVVILIGVWFVKKYKPDNMWFLTGACLVLGGGVGNMIDRLFLGYVRDFINVAFIDFPIFNFADCLICIGAGLLMVYAFRTVDES